MNYDFFNKIKVSSKLFTLIDIEIQESLIDSFYEKGELVIPKTSSEENALTKNNTELIECISAFSIVSKEHYEEDSDVIQKIIFRIINILDETLHINYSAFVQFFMVYNASFSIYKKLTNSEKRKFIYEILTAYIKERHSVYLSHGYSNSILQVMSDNYSHKRNSKTGIEKALDILPKHLVPIKKLSKLSKINSGYFLPDKGDSELFEKFLSSYAIEFKSRNTEQNKFPDLVFYNNEHFFITELKTMKEGGGGQNKQIVEIAYFIRYNESNEKIHYVSYLDGLYSNLLFNETQPKIKTQRTDIKNSLMKNKSNYFVNTAGFTKLTQDIYNDNI